MSWLRAWYGDSLLVAVSEHWEKHERLLDLLLHVEECELRDAVMRRAQG